MIWQEVSGNWVLLPPRPVAIIHFLGGAFVATAPQTTYRRLLEFLGRQGYAIIATPFLNTLDHGAIAKAAHLSLEQTLSQLHSQRRLKRFLPIYGLGHSMGCKLHLLIGSLFEVNRAGNMLLAFNNFSARQAIPLMESFAFATALEFTPTPEQTNRLVLERYQVRRNLLVKFTQDEIDQTSELNALLQQRFSGMVSLQRLPGNHLTPLGQDLNWQAGSAFTPLDALGQWVRQGIYRELQQLEQAILFWLEPLAKF